LLREKGEIYHMPNKKLYPPQIENTLPAFYGNELVVPFALTRALSPKDFMKVAIIVKSV
jgi:hypothetical protein